MKQPIDVLLDSLEYEAVKMKPTNEKSKSGLPHVTHEGKLKIADKELRVYLLSDGQRVIDADDLEKFFVSNKKEVLLSTINNLNNQ